MKRAQPYLSGPVNSSGSQRDPMTAAMLSVVPGLGQLYNGDNRKGFLFLDVAALNFVLLWFMIFAGPIVKFMRDVAPYVHLRADDGVLHSFEQLHLGSPLSTLLLMLVLGFGAYAVRDAYDTAMALRRRALYPDSVLDIPEAASGSYLLHLAMMMSCCVIACFFIAPRAPRSQITEIEFVATEQATKAPERAIKKADKDHVAQGKVVPNRTVQPASSSSASSAARTRVTPARTTAAEAPPQRPVPTPAQTEPTPARPMPAVKPMPVQPRTQDLPAPPVPLPATAPRPVQSAPGSLPTPTVNRAASAPAPAAPVLPTVASGAFMPAPSSVAIGHSALVAPSAPRATASSSGPAVDTAPAPVSASSSSHSTTWAPAPAAASSSAQDGHGKRGTGPSPTKVSAASPSGNDLLAINPNIGHSTPRSEDRPGGTDVPGRDGPAHPPVKAQPNFGEYMANLQRRIKRNWFPRKTPNSQRTVVTFKVSPTGEMSGLQLVRSSGSAMIDEDAMKAVRLSAPLPHLPAGADDTVDIEFTFDYNVFGDPRSTVRF